MRLFSLSPLTTATLSPSNIAPISRPFKCLILRRLFTLSPRSLLPFFKGDTSFSLSRVPLPPLHPVGRRLLPFFPSRLLRVLLGVMTLPPSRLRPGHPPSRLRPGHLLPPSSEIILFPPPPVAPILTGSPALLLSPGEWGFPFAIFIRLGFLYFLHGRAVSPGSIPRYHSRSDSYGRLWR